MPRRHWWNNLDDIEIVSSNHTGPLDQSSPRGFRLNELDNDSITEDLEDSLLRLNTVRQHENILNELDQVPSEVESIVLPLEPEICTDVRGRKITVTEDIPLTRTRSRSKTPFKIRDNLSHLFGWDKLLDTDPEYEEEASEVEGEGTDTPQPVEEYPKLKYWKPCSRLALLDNDQFSAFLFELSLIKNHINDFPLNFPWVIWITRSSKTEVKTVVENAIDLKLATKYIKGIYQECKVMVFKLGVLPKRKIPENINGISIDIQVNHDYDFDAFKDIVNMTLNGALYKPDIDRMFFFFSFSYHTLIY